TDLMRIVTEFKPDILHVQWRSLTPFAQLVRLSRRIPFVTTLNFASIPCNPLYRLLSFWGDCAIAVSQDTYDVLASTFSVPATKLRIIYYGCDGEHFRPPTPEERNAARESFGIKPSDYAASMIARLSPEKRHEVAIRGVAALRS